MGKIRGNRRGKLVDMAVVPRQYKPPPCPPAEETTTPIDITEVDRLVIRQKIYRTNLVDFAIMQIRLEDDDWREIARIDCCHGMIHRHQFDQDGNDVDGHVEIKAIPGDGDKQWELIQDGYYDALAVMYEEWEDNLRRWRDGR